MMKFFKKIIYIYTSLIIIFSFVVCSFPSLSASAAERDDLKEYRFDSIGSSTWTYSGQSVAINPAPVLGSASLADAHINTGSGNNFGEIYGYTDYINFTWLETVDHAGIPIYNLPKFSFFMIPNSFNELTNKSGINYFEFNFGACFPNTASNNNISYILVKLNNEYTDKITISYNFGAVQVGTFETNGVTTSYIWRPVNCQLLWDPDFQFDNDDVLTITLRSNAVYAERPQAPSMDLGPVPLNYSLGLSPIRVGYKTTDEYLSAIGTAVNNIESTVVEISEGLKTTLTPEQQEVVNSYNEKKDIVTGNESYIDSQVSDYVNNYNSNPITFDTVSFDSELNNHFTTVFADGPFLAFWELLWFNPVVLSMMILVIAFTVVGFVLYGVR